MRVTSNSGYLEVVNLLNKAASDLAERQKVASSGRRLMTPSDDPTGAVASISERAELAVVDRYEQASDTASSRLSIVDGLLTEINDQLTSAKVAIVGAQGSSGTETSRDAAAAQLTGVRDAILNAMNTQFRGSFVFAGSAATTQPYEKTGNTISAYKGAGQPIEIEINRQVSVASGTAGDAIMKGSDAVDLFTALDQAAQAVKTGDAAGMQTGLDALSRALTRVGTAQGHVGNDLATIATQQTLLKTRSLGGQARLSKIEDANMAEAISSMSRAETAYKTALSALGSTQRLSLLDYLQ
jgi:flagellar hook-associated protein 3 FlgL